MRRLALALLLVAPPLVSRAAPRPSDGTCTATLAGAVTASFACSVSARQEGDRVRVTLVASEVPAGLESLGPTVIELAGPPAVGSWTETTARSASAALATGAGGYALAAGAGSLSLAIDQLERERSGGFTLQGSLQVALAPAPGSAARGNIRIDARF